MSSELVTTLKINVTNGDALHECRTSGKSNTGTYFVCNINEVDSINKYFDNKLKYVFDWRKTILYCDSLIKFVDLTIYVNDEKVVKKYCKCFEELKHNVETNVNVRVNDERIFMRFNDNNGKYTKIFRNILYSKITNIVLELKNNVCYVYPELNYKVLK